LGKSGIEISSIAWGMWRFAGLEMSAARAAIDAAFEAGITLFDTADIYGFGEQGFGKAEELLGRVFAEAPEYRDRMVLATKGGITPPTPYNSSAEYLTKAIDDSLSRLGTDYVDLWQIHRPDILTHPQEIARTIENAHKAGKIRAFGVSNFTTAQITTLAQFSSVPIVSTQPELCGSIPSIMASLIKLSPWIWPCWHGRHLAAVVSEIPATHANKMSRQPCRALRRHMACRGRQRPIAGSWHILPGRSRLSDRKTRHASWRLQMPSKSNGPALIGTAYWSRREEFPCHEQSNRSQLVLRIMRR
jgi:hypothetical protein